MRVKVVYVIPLLLLANMMFVMHLHTSYMGAIEELEQERKRVEDLKYHIQNNPDIEPLKEALVEREVFSNWWGGPELSDPLASLIIGIPSVPRAQRYLTDTLASIVPQLPSSNPEYDTPWREKIKIIVVNNKPDMEFEEFEELKQKYDSIPELSFVINDKKIDDRYKDQPDPDDFNNPDDIPGKKVRAQTYDLISLLKIAEGKSEYFLFMEDDFPICPSALDTFYYIIRKANIYQPNWKAIRSSYGMNGIFVRGSHVQELAAFLHENVAHRPPDGLAVEWMCGKLSPTAETCENPQRHFTFKWNLFKHIGAVSSLRQTGLEKFPGCWAFFSNLLWEVDGFKIKDCPDDDLWPCHFRPDAERLPKTLDMEGWPYINGYFNVIEQYGDIDVSLIQRPLRLIYSGPSPATRASPHFFTSFLAVAFCVVVWKIMLWR